MSEKIKLGILGVMPGVFGGRGFFVEGENGMEPIGGVDPVAVADINEKNRQGYQDFYNIPDGYSDYRELLARDDIDAVLITLPTFLHKEATILALEAGKSVLCEKPPANDYEEMKEIAAVAAKAKGRYMFVRQSRFSDKVQAVKKAVEEGKLGRLYGAEAKWIRTRGAQVRQVSWRSDRARGGGVLLDLGIHMIDQLWFAMGCPNPVEVSGHGHAVFQEFSDQPEAYTADDNFQSWIRFDNGVTLQGTFAFGMNQVLPAEAGGKDLSHQTEWKLSKLFGTKAGVDMIRGDWVSGPPEEAVVTSLGVSHSPRMGDFQRQAEHFIECVKTGATPINSAENALVLMKMLSAMERSSEQGRAIRLDTGEW